MLGDTASCNYSTHSSAVLYRNIFRYWLACGIDSQCIMMYDGPAPRRTILEPDLIALDLNLPRLSGSSFRAYAKPKAPW